MYARVVANLKFDLVTLKALAVDTSASAFGLSGMSQQMLLAVSEILEDHENWFGAGDELTDDETDEIDAAVALMESEIMAELGLGSMAEQNADAVDIDGGTINGISELTGLMAQDIKFERDANVMRLILQTFHTFGGSLDLNFARGSRAVPVALSLNDLFGDIRWRGYDGAAFQTGAYIRGQASENWAVGVRGTKLLFNVTPNGGTALNTGMTLDQDKSLTVNGNFQFKGSQVGFFNHALASKPAITGSRGGNAALAALLTALNGLGLITDSSSA